MPADVSHVGYFIWGVDCAAYGPIELPTLVAWIKAERIIAGTWIFLERNDSWEQADRIPELRMFFHSERGTAPELAAAPRPEGPLSPGALRHIKVLACLNDEQLEKLIQLVRVETIRGGTLLVRQGDPADAMYLLVEGELRIRVVAQEHETSLGNLNVGEFFGEICLFDHGPRLADVIATRDSTLIKITAADFERITNEFPDVAAPFLFALAKTLSCRIRAEFRRYRDSLSFIHPPTGAGFAPSATNPAWFRSAESR